MEFKEGDRVKLVEFDDAKSANGLLAHYKMEEYFGGVVTISKRLRNERYLIKEDEGKWKWTVGWMTPVEKPEQEPVLEPEQDNPLDVLLPLMDSLKTLGIMDTNLETMIKEYAGMFKKHLSIKDYEKTYKFRDTIVNMDQMCNDAIRDGAPAFVAETGHTVFIGVIRCDDIKLADIFLEDRKGGVVKSDLPFDIYAFDVESLRDCKHFAMQFTLEYRAWVAKKDAEIKDRTRDKTGALEVIVTTF